MNPKLSAVLIALTVTWSIQARTNLQADLQAMTPAGQTMRLVYQKGGPLSQNNGYGADNTANPNVAIYAVSSTDGVVKQIYPATGTGNYHVLNITYDGNRVVFYDFNANQVVVINYTTGAELKRFAAPMLYDYWYNPADGTEWAITCPDAGPLARYNINLTSPSAVTILASVSSYCQISDARTVTISDDGLKVLLCKGDKPALLTLSSNSVLSGLGGCWYMMRSGKNAAGLIEYSQNNGNGLDHRGPEIFNENGTRTAAVHVSDTLDKFIAAHSSLELTGCPDSPSGWNGHHCADGLRWLRNRDYFSITIQECKIGPILWRMSDYKWTYIEDGLSCTYAGDMDGITATSFTDVIQQPGVHSSALPRQTREPGSYSIDGRLLTQSAMAPHSSHKGIVISQSATGAVTRIYK